MSDFGSRTDVKRTRKLHGCYHCERDIAIGSPAVVMSGSYFGDFYSEYEHLECEVAAFAYAQMTGLWGEEFTRIADLDEPSDMEWLIAEHPAVAERIRAAERIEARKSADRAWRAMSEASRGKQRERARPSLRHHRQRLPRRGALQREIAV